MILSVTQGPRTARATRQRDLMELLEYSRESEGFGEKPPIWYYAVGEASLRDTLTACCATAPLNRGCGDGISTAHEIRATFSHEPVYRLAPI